MNEHDEVRRAIEEFGSVGIIGAAGFLGRSLVNNLGKRVGWLADLRTNGDCEVCDVCDVSALTHSLKTSNVNWLINLAAEHRDDVRPISRYAEVNEGGAAAACAACESLGIERQVFVSSVAVYGDSQGAPFVEDSLHRATHPYGASKSKSERIYRRWQAADTHRRTLIIIRPTVIFGPGNRGNLYNLIAEIAAGRFRMVGPGDHVKSICYVGNVAAAICFLMKNLKSGQHIYNYSDDPAPTVLELVQTVRQALCQEKRMSTIPYSVALSGGMVFDVLSRVTGRRYSISSQRVRKFCSASPVDSSRIRAEGFIAPVPVLDALRQTVEIEFPQ